MLQHEGTPTRLHSFFDAAELHRAEKIVYLKFQQPFRVGSTCQACGGVRDDLEYVYNHQSCEPSGHHPKLLQSAMGDPTEYHQAVCDFYGFPTNRAAALGTAANMNNLGLARFQFRELEVVALATAGVETNAARAGEPAGYYEANHQFERVSDSQQDTTGTINVIILVNQELTLGATVRAAITATEAKTTVLQELVVDSRYSCGMATGTGTDQIAVASKIGGGSPLGGAGPHTKLGELVARATQDAIRESLSLQNQMAPKSRCSVSVHLERFGVREETLCDYIAAGLPAEKANLLRRNFAGLDRDPLTVASVAALIRVVDETGWGVLPKSCLGEMLAAQGAVVAAAVSGKYERNPSYRVALAEQAQRTNRANLAEFVAAALARGFADKWEHLEAAPDGAAATEP